MAANPILMRLPKTGEWERLADSRLVANILMFAPITNSGDVLLRIDDGDPVGIPPTSILYFGEVDLSRIEVRGNLLTSALLVSGENA